MQRKGECKIMKGYKTPFLLMEMRHKLKVWPFLRGEFFPSHPTSTKRSSYKKYPRRRRRKRRWKEGDLASGWSIEEESMLWMSWLSIKNLSKTWHGKGLRISRKEIPAIENKMTEGLGGFFWMGIGRNMQKKNKMGQLAQLVCIVNVCKGSGVFFRASPFQPTGLY